MSDAIVLSRLRHFLLGLAAFMSVGTVVELALTQHWENGVQILPFVLCGVSFILIMAALLRPQRRWVRLLRWVMVITLIGSLFGVYEHIEHNIAFALEIRPTAVVSDIFLEALGVSWPLRRCLPWLPPIIIRYFIEK
jgi:disulfide bond formation protein DsbB